MSIDGKMKIAEELGWTIECESPLEIRDADGNFATGLAALIVLDYLVENKDDL